MKINRHGSAVWSGGIKDGKGAISTESGALEAYLTNAIGLVTPKRAMRSVTLGLDPGCASLGASRLRSWGPAKGGSHEETCRVGTFIRSDLRLDVFGERFRLPPEAEYEYVVATVDVARHRLRVRLGDDPVAEFPYALR